MRHYLKILTKPLLICLLWDNVVIIQFSAEIVIGIFMNLRTLDDKLVIFLGNVKYIIKYPTQAISASSVGFYANIKRGKSPTDDIFASSKNIFLVK